MKTKAYLKALPIVAALLLTAACNNQDLVVVDEPQPDQVRIIPYTAIVSSGIPTRVTLNGEDKYEFQTGDQLYVWGEDATGKIDGALQMVSGAGSYDASFKGNLSWIGSTTKPADSFVLNAVIVSSNNEIFGSFTNFKGNAYKPKYTASIASSDADAVQAYSHFEAQAYYAGTGSGFYFQGKQKSAFVSFDITLPNDTPTDADVTVKILNGGIEVRSDDVRPVDEGGVIKAKFTAGFPGGYSLSNVTVTLGSITINVGGNLTLNANGLYKVSRAYPGHTITVSSAGVDDMTIFNLPIGYTTTLKTVLNGLGLSTIANLLKYCTCSQGTGGDEYIKMTEISPGNDDHDYQFEVLKAGGSSAFTVSTTSLSQVVSIAVN